MATLNDEEIVHLLHEADFSDSDEEIVSDLHSDHQSESEESESDSDLYDRREDDISSTEFFYGKNKTFKWCKMEPPQNTRTRRHNIILQLPGLRQKAKNLGNNPNIECIWKLLFCEDIMKEIITRTNAKIVEMRKKFTSSQDLSYLHDLDLIEFKGFIGLLVFTAIFKSGNENIDSLFATDGTGRDIFRCTMSRNRFLFLLSTLRFDNADDRHERKQTDAAAAITAIFNKFLENSQACLSLGPSVCVDEMLVPFRGRCKFRVYMPKKPAKYGLKIMCLTDARNSYLFNAYIYTGKGSDGMTLSDEEKLLNIPSQAVIRLIKPIEKSRRNVTADNWFSSIQLVKELQKRELTYVGTLKKNKSEIPVEFLPHRSRTVNSSLYGFSEDITMLSYVPKKSKAVLLISSMHHSRSVDEETGKPEIISYYNLTKGGVDSLDQKCANYSASRRTRRWPMAIFFTLIDISTVNAYVIFQAFKDTPKMTRLDFMKTLAKALTYPVMTYRLQNRTLPQQLSSSIKRILGVGEEIAEQEEHETFETRRTCFLCSPKLKRKTRYPCFKCARPICLQCAKKVCKECAHK